MIGHFKNKGGFTLLEIMVAITILALMALMLSRIFSESTRAVERGTSQALLDETARLLLNYIEQDVSQALIRTNVAFRVHDEDSNDALYFVSTAVRRPLETIPRDTAPIRLQATRDSSSGSGLFPNWNRFASILSPYGSATESAGSIENLLEHSDYYFTAPDQTAGDFKTIHGDLDLSTIESEYTQPLSGTSGTESHAALTFMDITINGDRNSNSSINGQPNPADMPRFVDVVIGLISSTELEQAMRLRSAGNQPRAENHIMNKERIYTRRIFMRNQGADQLTFQ